MLDSGSMACTLSSGVMPQLLQGAVLTFTELEPTDVVLIGCGGSKTTPSGMRDLEVEVFGCRVVVLTLVVNGQSDDIIIGSNLLRFLVNNLELNGNSDAHISGSDSQERLLSLMAGVQECKEDLSGKAGTVKIKRAVTLEPMSEHLVWGELQQWSADLASSKVVTEPMSVRSRPRSVIVGRTVALLTDDGWLPLTVINPSERPVTLRRNAKLADVYPCVALENFSNLRDTSGHQPGVQQNF